MTSSASRSAPPSGGADRTVRYARELLATGRAVALVGPAGIGKTTTAARVTCDRRFVPAQCLGALTAMPYRPLSHAFGSTFADAPDAVATEVAARLEDRLLVIEDLHWADDQTLRVAHLLADRLPMLATSRSRSAVAQSAFETIDVEPLDDASADALVAAAHPELSPSGRAQLTAAAAGNPLMLLHLARGGAISPTFEAAVAARVDDLPTEVRTGLARLALHGRPVAPDRFDVPAPERSDGVLTETGDGIWFVHERFASAILELLDDDEGRRLRAELAAASDPVDAARHHVALGDLDAAAQSALVAAEDADLATRSHLLALAADALGDRADSELLLRAADAMISAHRTTDARRFAGTVRGDAQALAEAGLHLARAAWLDGDIAAASDLIERALANVEGTGSKVEAQLVIERASVAARTRVGDPAILAIADEALAAAERVGVERPMALSAAGLARSHTGQPGWDELFRDAAEAARAEGDEEQECAAVYWHVSALGFYGPMSHAIELGREMVARTSRTGPMRWHHHFLGALAVHLTASGVVDDDVLAACRRLLADEPLFRNRAQVELAIIVALTDRDQLDEAAAVAAEAMRHTRSDEERAIICCARCELAFAARDPQRMREALTDLAACGPGFFGLNAVAESAALHLAVAMPDRYDMPRVATRLTPVLDVVEVERQAVDLHAAGRTTDAVDAMARAAETWETRRLARFARRAACGMVEIALSAGELDTAARLLERAATQIDPTVQDASARRLDDLRRAVSRAQVSRWLTDREIEVLVLVAAGLTTKQIAERLGISASTVDSHIASAMRQLGCRTRAQAAAIVVA